MNFIPFLPYMIPFGSEGKFLSISCTYNGMFVPETQRYSTAHRIYKGTQAKGNMGCGS